MLGWCSTVCFCCISEGTMCTLSILFMAPHADVTVLVMVCFWVCVYVSLFVCEQWWIHASVLLMLNERQALAQSYDSTLGPAVVT